MDIAGNEDSSSKAAKELMTIFSEIGELKHLTPDSDEVQKKITELQEFITDNYYVCTDEILSGLGEMYVTNALRRILTEQEGTVLLNLSVRLFWCQFLKCCPESIDAICTAVWELEKAGRITCRQTKEP